MARLRWPYRGRRGEGLCEPRRRGPRSMCGRDPSPSPVPRGAGRRPYGGPAGAGPRFALRRPCTPPEDVPAFWPGALSPEPPRGSGLPGTCLLVAGREGWAPRIIRGDRVCNRVLTLDAKRLPTTSPKTDRRSLIVFEATMILSSGGIYSTGSCCRVPFFAGAHPCPQARGALCRARHWLMDCARSKPSL